MNPKSEQEISKEGYRKMVTLDAKTTVSFFL